MKKTTVLILFFLLMALQAAAIRPALAEERQAAEYDLKAAFILNFARFIDSPADNDTSHLICYAGNEQVAVSLAALRGKMVRNRPIEIKLCTTESQVKAADLLFIPTSEQQHADELLAMVKGKPVLTIGEYPNFRGQGGMIQLYVDQEQIIFNVNLLAVRESGVRVHPQLLKLAHDVQE